MSASMHTMAGAQYNAQALTALEIARNMDALPRAGSTTEDTAGCPSRSHLRTGAAANPAPPANGWLLGRTRPWSHTLAVADDRRALAYTRRRVD